MIKFNICIYVKQPFTKMWRSWCQVSKKDSAEYTYIKELNYVLLESNVAGRPITPDDSPSIAPVEAHKQKKKSVRPTWCV